MGRSRDRKCIYHGDSQWLADAGFCWFDKQPFQSQEWHSDGQGLSFKLIRKISERVNKLPLYDEDAAYAAAVYVAEQISGKSEPSQGSKVIMKIHMRIPNIARKECHEYVSTQDLKSHDMPVDEEYPDESSQAYDNEVASLRHLTDHNCAYTPSLITTFQDYTHNPWVKGGFIGFIVMERLSAVTLSDIWEWEPSFDAQRQEQLRIQEAFKHALLSVTNLGVGLLDEAARNLMWDWKAGKCYLIDFEYTVISKEKEVMTWQEYTRRRPSPFSNFSDWDIIMEDQYQALRKDIDNRHK